MALLVLPGARLSESLLYCVPPAGFPRAVRFEALSAGLAPRASLEVIASPPDCGSRHTDAVAGCPIDSR